MSARLQAAQRSSAGSLRLSTGTNRLASGSNVTVASGATLDLSGTSQTLDRLTSSTTGGGVGSVVNTSASASTLTLGSAASTYTADLPMSGSINLIKSGTGTVTMTGSQYLHGHNGDHERHPSGRKRERDSRRHRSHRGSDRRQRHGHL